jgi:iron complex transport system substrate-binding protein
MDLSLLRGKRGEVNRVQPLSPKGFRGFFIGFFMMGKSKAIFTFLFMCILVLMLGASAFQATYIDEMGREVNIPVNPKRIVSLAPSITETLYFMDLGDRVVGVTQFSNYPEEAKTKPKVGSYININIEKIISLKPDLIIAIADGNKKESVDTLQRLGYSVYAVNPKGVPDIFKTIENIGKITGCAIKAGNLVAGLRKRTYHIENTTKDINRPKVFIQIGINPIITVGKETFHNDLIRMAGGYNISGHEKAKYPQYSIEEVLLNAPDIIIISSMHRGGGFERRKEEWLRWKNIPAVSNGRICVIDSDLIDHPSPRIVDGLEELARLIHPEVFK